MVAKPTMRRHPADQVPSDGAVLLEFEEMVDALLEEAAMADEYTTSVSKESVGQSSGVSPVARQSSFFGDRGPGVRGDVRRKEEDGGQQDVVEQLRSEVDKKMARVKELEEGLKSMEKEINAMQCSLVEGRGSVETERSSEMRRLTQAFSSRERQVGKLIKTVKESKDRVEKLRGAVRGVGEREVRLKQGLESVNSVIPKLEKELLEVAKETSGVERSHEMKVSELKQRLEKAEKKGREREGRGAMTLERLKKQMEALEVEVKARKENIKQLQNEVEEKSEVEQKAEEIRAVWEKLENKNRRLGEDIAKAEAQFARLQPDMLKQLITESEQRIVAARQEQVDLQYQIETLHDSRFDDVQEVMYLRWINTCMRHELKVHKWSPSGGEVEGQKDSEWGGESTSSADVYLDDHGVNSLIVEDEDEGDGGKRAGWRQVGERREAKATEGERGDGEGAETQGSGQRVLMKRNRGLRREGGGQAQHERQSSDGSEISERSRERRLGDSPQRGSFSESPTESKGSSPDGLNEAKNLEKNRPPVAAKPGAASGKTTKAESAGRDSGKERKDKKLRPPMQKLKIPPRVEDAREADKTATKSASVADLAVAAAGRDAKDAPEDRLKPRKLRPPPKPSYPEGGGGYPPDAASAGLAHAGPPPLPPPLPPPRPPSKAGNGSEGAVPPPPPPLGAGGKGLKPGFGVKKQVFGARDEGIQRVPEVVRLYQSLTRKGSKKDSSATTPVARGVPQKGNARGQLIEEMESRSAYLMAIKQDVETQADFVNALAREVRNAEYSVIEDILAFVQWLDSELAYLVDERAVLKHFDWPEVKVDAFREAGFGFKDLQRLEKDVLDFDVDENLSCNDACKRIHSMLEKVESMVYALLRARDLLVRRFQEFSIPTYWLQDTGMIGKVKRATLNLARIYMRRVSDELDEFEDDLLEDPARQLLVLQAVRFSFRVHQFAGGFDSESMEVFEELRSHANLCIRKPGN